MTVARTPTAPGREASEKLHEAARSDERKVEARMGADLKKGKDRFEERSRSSDGQSPGRKQNLPTN
jgi:hypothetical protein